MEMFFATIGLLVVLGLLLRYWNSLDDRPRFNDGSLMNAAQARDWKRVQDARREEELREELARLQRKKDRGQGTTADNTVKPRDSESDARNRRYEEIWNEINKK